MIVYLAARNAGERFRHSNWRIFFAILEPLALICILTIAQVYLLNAAPAFGTSNLLFNASGIIPYYLFLHISLKIRGMDRLRTIPHTTWFDHALAYVAGELYVKGLMIFLVFTILYAYGVPDAAPRSVLMCILPLCLLACFGFSVGLINLVILGFWKAWYYVYVVLVRGLMMFSGVLFVVDLAPYNMREFCKYNPIAMSIVWFRYNVYDNYPAQSLDVPSLLISVAVLLLLAFLLEDRTREWRNYR